MAVNRFPMTAGTKSFTPLPQFNNTGCGIKNRVLLTSAPGALFKHSKTSNYSFKKSNISISNA